MSTSSLCHPCSRIDDSVLATNWCLDCDEALCGTCFKSHKTSKVSMKHQLVDIKAMSSIDCDLLADLNECKKHPRSAIELFCPAHEAICCRRCMTEEHRSCDRLVPLDDASQNVKKSSLLFETNKGMKEFLTTLHGFIKDRKQNKEDIKNQKKTIKASISELKQSLVRQLDKMEEAALVELESISNDAFAKTEEKETKAETCVQSIDKYLQQTEFMTNNASNPLLFTFLHQLQPKLKTEHDLIKDIITNASKLNMSFKSNENLLNKINSIGSIKTIHTPCDLEIIQSKNVAAQDVSATIDASIQTFTHACDFEGEFNCVTGIVVTKDDNVLLTDRQYLKMYNRQGKYIKQWKLDGDTWDLSCHQSSSRVVVTLQSNGIQILDNFILQPKIRVLGLESCYGITFINGNIAVGGDGGKISILDYNGGYIRTINTETKGTIHYLHYHQRQLYFTDCSNKVYCIMEDGTHKQTITVEEISGMEAVTSDHIGNIYVAGYNSNNVVQISTKDKSSRVLIKKKDGIVNPYAICFAGDYKTFFISCNNGTVVKAFKCKY